MTSSSFRRERFAAESTARAPLKAAKAGRGGSGSPGAPARVGGLRRRRPGLARLAFASFAGGPPQRSWLRSALARGDAPFGRGETSR